MLNVTAPLLRYSAAVCFTALALFASLLLDPLLHRSPFLLFYAAVALSAWHGGFGPALLSTSLALLSGNYFFLPPAYGWSRAGEDILRLAIFAAVALLISMLHASAKRLLVRERQARAEAETAKKKITAVLESITDGFFTVDRQWRCSHADQKAVDLFQIPREKLPGGVVWDWIPEPARQQVQEHLERAASEQAPVHFETFDPGWGAWVEYHAYPSCEGLSVFVRDVTERRRQVDDIQRREQEISDFIENAAIGLQWVGPEGTILWANQAELDLVGYSKEEYLGHHITEFYADKAVIEDILRRLAANETIRDYEARMVRKDGSIRHVVINSNVRWENGKFLHTRCFTRDITEQKRADEQIGARARELAALTELRRQALATQDLPPLFNEAAVLVARTLRARYVSILELLPDGDLLLRAGEGWKEGYLGRATLPATSDFQAGQTVLSGEPVAVSDSRNEQSFQVPDWLAEHELAGGLTVIIRGRERPFGVLGVYATEARTFAPEEVLFLQGVADDLALAIERHLVLDHLRESEGRFRALFNQVTAGIAQTDLAGRFVHVNQQFCDLVGRRMDQILLLRVQDLIHPEDWGAHSALFDRLAAGESACWIEHRCLRPDGSEVWISNSLSVVTDREGRPRYAVAVALDITGRKAVEETRARLLERERAARVAAERADRLKDEFLATVSHELRTPLTAILGWTKLLRGSQLDDAMRRQGLETIERNAKTQARLVDDILDASRIIVGKLRLETRLVRLTDVLDAALRAFRPVAEERGVALHSAAPCPEPCVVSGDPRRLEQVFSNLLSNAVKFTPEGGSVEVGVARNGSQVQVTVSDTGVGISPELLPYIFERFRQGENPVEHGQRGLGLGLAIVRHLVEMHGGAVEARSAGERQGTTFTVCLPLAEDPRLAHAAAVTRTEVRPSRLDPRSKQPA